MPDRAETDQPASAVHPKAHGRTTNDVLALSRVDGRLTWARRRRDLIRAFTGELGRAPNTRDQVLITALASSVVRSEQIQRAIALGEHVDDENLVRLGNVVTRLIASLGLKSAKPEQPPSLQRYLDERAR